MDRIIKVRVNGSHLEKDSRYAGVQGECNARHLHITFDQGWDGQAKTVTFWDALGLNPVKRTLTADLLADMLQDTRSYLVPIPGEAMTEAGEMTFVIDGWSEGVYREPEDVATLVLAVTLEKVTGKTIAAEVFDEALYETVTGKEIYFGEYHYTIEQVEPVKGGFPILHLDRPPYEAEGTEYGTQLPVKTKRETLVAPVRQRSVKAELIVQESPMELEAGEPTDPTPSQAEQLQAQIDTLLGDMQDRAVRAENAAQAAQSSELNAEQHAVNAEESAKAADSSEANALASEQAAALSAQAAQESEKNALAYESGAYAYMQDAQQARDDVAASAAAAANAQAAAAESARQAASSENFADGYMQDAKLAAEEAARSARVAEQYQNSSQECGAASASAQASAAAAAQSAKEAAEYAEQAAEIAGGDISGVVDGKISGHNVSTTAHSDIRQAVQAAQTAAQTAQKTAEGKEASGTAASAVSAHNSSSAAHNDIRQAVSAAAAAAASAQQTADSKATMEQVNEAIAKIPTPDVSGQISTHNSSTTAHADIRQLANNAAAAAQTAQQTAEGRAPMYSYGSEDLVAGTTALETGKLHFVYEI